MIYGYIRVSTDKQTVENQRFAINEFCLKEHIKIDEWIEETVSGTQDLKKRTLGMLLEKMKKGDTLIAPEISRLGRNILMIMGILNECMNREIKIYTIKEGYKLGNDIGSKVLAFAFSMSAEIERQLISQRITESLRRKKAEGVKLGRPFGSMSNRVKLMGKEKEIKQLLTKKVSLSAIGRIYGVHRLTVVAFCQRLENKDLLTLLPDRERRPLLLINKEEAIKNLLKNGTTGTAIAETLGVNKETLYNFIKKRNIIQK